MELFVPRKKSFWVIVKISVFNRESQFGRSPILNQKPAKKIVAEIKDAEIYKGVIHK